MEEAERASLQTDIARIKLALQVEADRSSDEYEDEEDEDVLFMDTNEPAEELSTSAQDVPPVHEDNEEASLELDLNDPDKLKNTPLVCLALNRAYQDIVQENLTRIEEALQENVQKQVMLMDTMQRQREGTVREKKPWRFSAFVSPFFKDYNGMVAPQNEDTLMKKASQEPGPHVGPPKAWNTADKKKLKNAVKESILKRRLQPLVNKISIEYEKKKKVVEDSELELINNRLKALNAEIDSIKKSTDIEVQYGKIDEAHLVDWLKISSHDFDGRRSAVNCRLMWCNLLHPSIKSSKWTKEEDEQLEKLAAEANHSHWDTIAENLGTGRSAIQCLQRYQTKLNPAVRDPWTPEEDAFLKEVVEVVRTGSHINWTQVAFYVDGRSTERCRERWETLTVKTTRRGKWTTEEDERLIDAVNRFGNTDYTRIAVYVGTRNASQCRERWANSLDKRLKFGNWKYKEDKLLWLETRVNQSTGKFNWCEIASKLEGRTDNMCLQRYRMLVRYSEHMTSVESLPLPILVGLMCDETRMKTLFLGDEDITQLEGVKKVLLQLIRKSPRNLTVENQAETVNNELSDQQKLALFKMSQHYFLREQVTRLTKKGLINHESFEELTEILEDMHNGVFIPRPHPTAAVNLHKQGVRRKKLRSYITYRAQAKLSKKSAKWKGKEEDADLAEACGDWACLALKGNPTIRDVIKAERESLNAVLGKSCKPIGRPRESEESQLVNELLQKALRSCIRTKPPGRPRSMVNILHNPTVEEKSHVEREVFKLLYIALSADQKGMLREANKMVRVLQAHPTTPADHFHGLADLTKKPPQLLIHLDQIDCVPRCPQYRLSSDLCVLRSWLGNVHLGDGGPEEEPGECIDFVRRRKAVTGKEAIKEYSMPPLPPMCSTLCAFKQLLLKQSALKKHAGTFHQPGSLEALPQRAASEVRIKQEGGIIRRQLTPEDIDPHQLPASVTVQSMVNTRRLLSQNHVTTAAHVPRSDISRITQTHDYQKLRGRFFSTFLWPALLSAFQPPQEAEPKLPAAQTVEPRGRRKSRKRRLAERLWPKGKLDAIREAKRAKLHEEDPDRPKLGRPKGSRNRHKQESVGVRRESSRIALLRDLQEEKQQQDLALKEAQAREEQAAIAEATAVSSIGQVPLEGAAVATPALAASQTLTGGDAVYVVPWTLPPGAAILDLGPFLVNAAGQGQVVQVPVGSMMAGNLVSQAQGQSYGIQMDVGGHCAAHVADSQEQLNGGVTCEIHAETDGARPKVDLPCVTPSECHGSDLNVVVQPNEIGMGSSEIQIKPEMPRETEGENCVDQLNGGLPVEPLMESKGDV